MSKCLIRVMFKNKGKFYSKEVEGEEVVIPEFEQIKLFTHFEEDEELDKCWGVSEVTTGLAIVHTNACMPTKEAAVSSATKKLNKAGLQRVLETIKSVNPPVAELSVFKKSNTGED
jgi:hypothetical protein